MDVLSTLISAAQSGHAAHAYLFEGPSNSKKKEAAEKFASFLLCRNLSACGSCDSCIMMKSGSHPDYHILSGDYDTIKIREHIAPFFSDIQMSSPYSNTKVYIIDEAHKMNSASQNSILKTLEEPVSNVVIILLTENSEMLLPTIISRVIRCTFPAEETDFENFSQDLKEKFFDIVKNIESPKASLRIKAAADISGQKEDLNNLLDMLQMYYRNSLVAKYTSRPMLIKGPKTDKISAEGAASAVKIIDETRFAIKSNANKHLAADVMVMELHDLYGNT